MIVRLDEPSPYRFTSITQQHYRQKEMQLDFGILRLGPGTRKTFPVGCEGAWMLIEGLKRWGITLGYKFDL
jgi:hypothetical protein